MFLWLNNKKRLEWRLSWSPCFRTKQTLINCDDYLFRLFMKNKRLIWSGCVNLFCFLKNESNKSFVSILLSMDLQYPMKATADFDRKGLFILNHSKLSHYNILARERILMIHLNDFIRVKSPFWWVSQELNLDLFWNLRYRETFHPKAFKDYFW